MNFEFVSGFCIVMPEDKITVVTKNIKGKMVGEMRGSQPTAHTIKPNTD